MYDDDYLIYLVRQHQEYAKDILYKKYYRICYSVMNKYDIKQEAKEEIVQEAMKNIFLSLPKFRDDKYLFFPYAYQIIRRSIFAYFRKKVYYDKRIKAYKKSLTKDMLLCNYHAYETIWVDCEKVLSPLQYKVIIYRYVYNYSMDTIAKKLHISVKKVYNTIYCAKKSLHVFWSDVDKT